MTTWSVQLTDSAVRELRALERQSQLRIAAAIELLRENPFPPRAVKLTGRDAYRVRVGDSRIIYSVNGPVMTILIIRVAHRREVYRLS